MTPQADYDPGSFRDRDSRVLVKDDRIFRVLSPRASANWDRLRSSQFFHRLLESNKIVATWEADESHVPTSTATDRWCRVLEHERIPFLSYPYEWTFSMLKRAALLQLEILVESIAANLWLQDASSYNIQWFGTQPVFIDIGSFEEYPEGEPWVGYNQFCQLFLYPLMLTAYRGVSYQPLLRGTIDGIDPEFMRNLMSMRDLLRRGVFTNVVMQSHLNRAARDSNFSIRSTVREMRFPKESLLNLLNQLRNLVSSLEWNPRKSVWSDYEETHQYPADDQDFKSKFVVDIAASRKPALVWDLGSNTGSYSLLVAPHADYVIGIEADTVAVEKFYRRLIDANVGNVLPLVNNLADPSPSLGWRGAERAPLTSRGQPDLILCLALVHHMVLAANVPMVEFLNWLGSFRADVVFEFVTRQDPMVKRLLLNKRDSYTDYGLSLIEEQLTGVFNVSSKAVLPSGTRHLYHLTPKT